MEKKKVVIVTGSSSGIGLSIAKLLLKNGYIVYGLDRNENFGDFETLKCDITNLDRVRECFDYINGKEGHIDVLVNNAGITKDMLLMRMTEDQFDDVINTNLKGTFNMIRHVSNVMLKQRSGAIINMASVVGINGNIGQANYAASKAGIIGLTKSTAKELASRGITCNAIAPGFVETDMTAVLKEDVQNAILSAIPLKRGGKVEDIARAAVFLAENDYITGQVLNVDGGMVM